MKRFGFTLVEVNLAIFVMAVGVLSMCSLYGLGYRENRQSEEDVFATAYADSMLAPLVVGLSSPQMKWEDWVQIGQQPSGTVMAEGIDARWPVQGWREYVETYTENGETHFRVISNPKGKADTVFQDLAGIAGRAGVTVGPPSFPNDNGKSYQYGLVATRQGAVVQLAFRMARRTQSLMSQPVFVAEIHFQGGFAEGDQ